MEQEIAVELKAVTKRFGAVTAVNHISLEIREGEFFSLLGPSGCGKTTTLRLIAGFEVPTEGEIYIENRLMNGTPPYRRNVNTVFQSYALFPHLTIFENVAFGLEMKHLPRSEIAERAGEALELVRLSGLEGRYPKQLSGGQQQRVALARALVNKPFVLLLDEPLGALDLKLRKQMQWELKQLQQKLGITFIYVTHDQEEALTMSDRIAVMNAGQILQVGTPTEIYERPSSRFVADFIGESNFCEGIIRELNGDTATVLVNDQLAICASATDSLREQMGVTVAVRPEKILLSRVPFRKTENAFAGTIEDLIYSGTDTHYLVRLTPSVLMRVRQQNLANNTLAPGERVYLHFPAESVRLLTEC